MSQHSSGKASRKLINESRAKIYSTFNLSEKDHHLMFHSGATEGISAFVSSFAEWTRKQGKDLLVCFSRIDHPAVVSLSEMYHGPHVKFFELEMNESLNTLHEKNYETLKDKKDNNPDLVILYHHLWVHNETGFISALSDLTKVKTIPDLYVHVDAVQAPGKIPDWQKLVNGDIFTFSPHKFGAIKGCGFTLFKKTVTFISQIPGGGQQQGLRGGTENPMAIHSIHLALIDLLKVDVARNASMKNDLEIFLKNELVGIGAVLSTETHQRNANTLYFFLNKLSSDISLALFDLNGLMISAGSACSSGAAKPSAVLTRSGLQSVAKNGLRISMGFTQTQEELEKIKSALAAVFSKIRSNSL